MRKILLEDIKEAVKELYLKANFSLPPFVKEQLEKAYEEEEGRGREVMKIIVENFKIAEREKIPLCQDTGMAVVFLRIGNEVYWEGDIEESINAGIKEAVKEGYLRSSTVVNPLDKRVNPGDNTPAVIHYELVKGEVFEITLLVKGFGSENATFLHLLPPQAGWEGVKEVVLKDVKEKGVNACPPLFIGVGVGGTCEKALELSKKALFDLSPMKEEEREILKEVNRLGIGPGGMGGRFTALRVKVKEYPTHIAGLPVAVSLNCHSLRFAKKNL